MVAEATGECLKLGCQCWSQGEWLGGAYLAHVGQPALLPLVYEAVDDEARLAVQLEVGGLHGGQVRGRDPLVHGEKGNSDVGLSKP